MSSPCSPVLVAGAMGSGLRGGLPCALCGGAAPGVVQCGSGSPGLQGLACGTAERGTSRNYPGRAASNVQPATPGRSQVPATSTTSCCSCGYDGQYYGLRGHRGRGLAAAHRSAATRPLPRWRLANPKYPQCSQLTTMRTNGVTVTVTVTAGCQPLPHSPQPTAPPPPPPLPLSSHLLSPMALMALAATGWLLRPDATDITATAPNGGSALDPPFICTATADLRHVLAFQAAPSPIR
jgi:hypothetical protein